MLPRGSACGQTLPRWMPAPKHCLWSTIPSPNMAPELCWFPIPIWRFQYNALRYHLDWSIFFRGCCRTSSKWTASKHFGAPSMTLETWVSILFDICFQAHLHCLSLRLRFSGKHFPNDYSQLYTKKKIGASSISFSDSATISSELMWTHRHAHFCSAPRVPSLTVVPATTSRAAPRMFHRSVV